MTQANDTPIDDLAPQLAPRRELGIALGTEQRSSRVLLRIPDCTSRLPSAGRESPGWLSKLQTVGDLGGPWFDLVRPVLPPRVLAAAAIGILLGIVLILLTPGAKHSPTIHTHSDQAAAGQGVTGPIGAGQRVAPAAPIEEPNGPRANIGTTGDGQAAKAAAHANAPARVDTGAAPRYENAQRPAEPRPAGKGWAELEGLN